MINPLAWLSGQALKTAWPALLALVAVAMILVSLLGVIGGVTSLVRSATEAHYQKEIATANEAATAAAAQRNEAAIAAEAAARDLAEQATGERERVLELEAQIRALQDDPVLFKAKPKGGAK